MNKLFPITFIIITGLFTILASHYWRSPSTYERKRVASPESVSLGQVQNPLSQPSKSVDPHWETDFNSSPLMSDSATAASRIKFSLDGLSLENSFIARLETIASPDAGSYAERHAEVQGLSSDLDEHQLQGIYRFLLAAPPEGELERRQDRAIKNDLINRLRLQDDLPAGLTRTLAMMYADPEQDEAVRNYALQQLRAWHERAPGEDYPLILEAIAKGLDEREGGIAGTALLAFRQFRKNSNIEGSNGGDGALQPDITETALKMTYSETFDELSRITAMQVAAQAAPERIIGIAARWALDAEAGYPRRLSAIAALGASGSVEATSILAQIEVQEDPHLDFAIQTAYKKLRQTDIELKP